MEFLEASPIDSYGINKIILESFTFYYVNATTARVKPNVFNVLEYGPTLTVRVLVIPKGVVKIAGADTEVNPAVYPREVQSQ